MQTHLKPLHDRLLVSRKKPETVSKGGIIIPSIAIEESNQGFVVAIGPKVEQVKVGDRIRFGNYAGSELQDDNGQDLIIMRESDVMAIDD